MHTRLEENGWGNMKKWKGTQDERVHFYDVVIKKKTSIGKKKK